MSAVGTDEMTVCRVFAIPSIPHAQRGFFFFGSGLSWFKQELQGQLRGRSQIR